jgi:hypothetical protein
MGSLRQDGTNILTLILNLIIRLSARNVRQKRKAAKVRICRHHSDYGYKPDKIREIRQPPGAIKL